jgi:hypothetical protein
MVNGSNDEIQQGGGSELKFFWSHGNEPLTPVAPIALHSRTTMNRECHMILRLSFQS